MNANQAQPRFDLGVGEAPKSDLPAWLGAVAILLLNLAAGYVLWAKVSSAWPF